MTAGDIWSQLESAIDSRDESRIRALVRSLKQESESHARELEERDAKLQKAERAHAEFLSMISHELRTPLNAIIGYNSMLEERIYGDLNEKQTKAVNHIDGNAARLLTLVNQLIQLSRLEAGASSVFHERIDLVTLTNEVLDGYQGMADEKNLEIDISHPRKGVSLTSDKIKIKEIVRQLVSNAIEFTLRGRIHIDVRSCESGGVLQVADTGPGFDSEKHDSIVKLFRLGEIETAHKRNGVGLGLSIVRRLADLIEAKVEVKSEPGKGAAVTVIIPSLLESAIESERLIDAEEDEEDSYAEREDPALVEPQTILIVDDDPNTVEMLCDYLENQGRYRVQKAYSGMHAMIHLAQQRPDYLLVDLLMPQINGERVIQYCNELWGDAVSIVAITGKDLTTEELKTLKCEVSSIIRKGDLTGNALNAALAAAIPIPAQIAL